jgi:hypothetical protein
MDCSFEMIDLPKLIFPFVFLLCNTSHLNFRCLLFIYQYIEFSVASLEPLTILPRPWADSGVDRGGLGPYEIKVCMKN